MIPKNMKELKEMWDDNLTFFENLQKLEADFCSDCNGKLEDIVKNGHTFIRCEVCKKTVAVSL